MSKFEYMQRLAALLKTVEKSERDRYLAYYSELIDDRMEEGLSEAEAVAGLENVSAAANRILTEAREQGKIKHGMSGGAIAAIVIGGLVFVAFVLYTIWGLTGYSIFAGRTGIAAPKTPPAIGSVDTSFPVEYELQEHSFSGDMPRVELNLIVSYIEVAPSPDDEFHLTYYISQEHPLEFIINVHPDSIKLEDTRSRIYTSIQISDLFSSRYSKSAEHTVTLLVPEGAKAKLGLATVSGGVMLYNVETGNDIDIANVSGDITMDGVKCGNFVIATVSGNSDINNLTADKLDLAATSGDFVLQNVKTGKIMCANVSGDFDIRNVSFTSLECGTVSGGLTGTLLGKPDDYKVDFASVSGRNSLAGKAGSGSVKIEFASVSGSLDLGFAS